MAKVTFKIVKGTEDKVVTEIGRGWNKKKITTVYNDYKFHCSKLLCSDWGGRHLTSSQASALAMEHQNSHNNDKPSGTRSGGGGVAGVKGGQGPQVRPDVVHGHAHSACGNTIHNCIRDDIPHAVVCGRCTTNTRTVYMDDWIFPPK